MCSGNLNAAAVPGPSTHDALLLPARVETTPVDVSYDRSRWLFVSTMYTKLLPTLHATPLGELKLAPIPIPSEKPAAPLPASV